MAPFTFRANNKLTSFPRNTIRALGSERGQPIGGTGDTDDSTNGQIASSFKGEEETPRQSTEWIPDARFLTSGRLPWRVQVTGVA